MQIDLHVHSKYSRRPSAWVLKKIGCPESFTEPMEIYRAAKARGMTMVTITDHNRIDGAMEIAHLPDTFVSEEITTYFPEDRCKLHVLALNITEAQHADIQATRENVYELVAYLHSEDICHVLAHALYPVNDRLTPMHFEKMLLLFKHFELNGARNEVSNQCLKMILGTLTPGMMAQLADRHGILPAFDRPWIKSITGGSDDHSGLNIARTYTVADGDNTVDNLIRQIRTGGSAAAGIAPRPESMAHNLYGIAYRFYRSKLRLSRRAEDDALMRFLDGTLGGTGRPRAGIMTRIVDFWQHRKHRQSLKQSPSSMLEILQNETRRLLAADDALAAVTDTVGRDGEDPERIWFDFVNRVSNRVLKRFADPLLNQLTGANVFDLFQTIGAAGGLYTLLAPYFVAYTLFSRDRAFARRMRRHFNLTEPQAASAERFLTVAHFTDTFYEVNGVALTLRQQAQVAASQGKDLIMMTCWPDAASADADNIQNFQPIGVFEVPEYPEQRIFYPPLLEMIQFCYDRQVSHIHCATPGPIGLAGLAIAHILKIPVTGTYHTQMPQYAMFLTGDAVIQDLTWRYMLWFYDQMDVVYAPSESTRREMVEKGIAEDKVRCYPRGIDVARFHPKHRNGVLRDVYGIRENLSFLYVGRVSKEKNLDLLAQAFRDLAARLPDIHLVVAGDGPYLPEMKTLLRGLPVTFTGYLSGDALAALYASCDVFVFPSTTDTFGNVVLEAQASGIPVIVTDVGGPVENVVAGETALVVPGNDLKALTSAMSDLAADGERRRLMGRRARASMAHRGFDGAFMQFWEMFKSVPDDREDGRVRMA
ncbi:MAG: glycosyltransferase [Pseudomonadota bacterium]